MESPNRWVMLSLGMAAQGAGCVFVYGLPYLIPTFEKELGLSLASAGLVVGAPSAGTLCTLIAWGWLADRFGERLAMTAGLALAAGFLTAAAFTRGAVALIVLIACAGAAAASANAASGRVVLGWFPAERRGVAMGWRQTAQPLGVAVAGVVVPLLPTVRGALLAMAGICAVVAVLVGILVVDPPRRVRDAGPAPSPYRNPALWRIHGASMLLVVPQFATAGFALAYLVSVRHWSTADAGHVIAITQLGGAAGRLLCGVWSDRVGSRLGPMRLLALVNGAVMALLAIAVALHSTAGDVALIAGLIVSMSGNGLAFTAVSELAGSAWAGRAMGAQNTGQNLVAAATPGLIGLLIGASGYGTAFAVAGVLAVTAALVTPRSDAGQGRVSVTAAPTTAGK